MHPKHPEARMAKRARRSEGPFARARRRRQRAWIVAGLSVAAFVIVSATVVRGSGQRSHHPTPRAVSEQPDVVPSSRYTQYPRVAETYKMAYAERATHYSLLDCFNSDHAARCDVCMSEAVIAYQMSQNGASLDAIRAEVDKTYGT
jgi:hypothetical protein